MVSVCQSLNSRVLLTKESSDYNCNLLYKRENFSPLKNIKNNGRLLDKD